MTIQGNTKKEVDNFIDNSSFGSPITITPRALTQGNYGGYEQVNENPSTSFQVRALVFNDIKTVQLEKSGNVITGDARIYVKSETELDEEDKVTFNSQDYDVRTVRFINLGGEQLCKVADLAKV